jgi:hypothetical protein
VCEHDDGLASCDAIFIGQEPTPQCRPNVKEVEKVRADRLTKGSLCRFVAPSSEAGNHSVDGREPLEALRAVAEIGIVGIQEVLDKEVTIVETSGPPGTPSVKRIERVRRDSVWNGVLIGAGAGALAGFGLGRSLDSPACPRPGIECGQGAMVGAVGGAFWGAIGGWITDALIRKRECVSPAQTAVESDLNR